MLKVKHATRTFNDGLAGFKNISFSIQEGETVGILGTSGCGKSTLLRVLSGLDQNFEGDIEVAGIGEHPIGMIFQEPRLMPWLTVKENILFGAKDAKKVDVKEYLDLVGLSDFGDHYPKDLSGGMAQRTAIARALIGEPGVLLLDEPFSALDAFTKMQLQDLLLKIQKSRSTTMIIVTHDIDEALYLCDRIFILGGQPGTLQSEISIETAKPRDRGDALLAGKKAEILDVLQIGRGRLNMANAEVIYPYEGNYNITADLPLREDFSWKAIESNFSWSDTGKVNMAYECVDRHVVDGFGEKVALRYFGEDEEYTLTYRELKEKSNLWATVLKKQGVKKGDFVFIFLAKHPDCHIAMLAAIKLGAVVGPLFEAFMEDAVKERIADCEGTYLIASPELIKRVPRAELPSLKTVWITAEPEQCKGDEISLYAEARATEVEDDIIEWVDLEHGLNIHYTSGSTGRPKGIIHAHRVMIQQYITGRWVLDLKEDDVYWCTAHPGWVTGTVYGVFAPLLNRATTVIHGGRFNADEWYSVLEKSGVTVWYSAPTAFRMLMAEGDEKLANYDLSKIRHILSVGEPLNPEVIRWGIKTLSNRIHDTWWMTETGAQLIVNLPSEKIIPGSMGRPFPGIEAAILDDDGEELPSGEVGHLALKANWPAIMREVWKDPAKYATYFPFEGWYVSGDLATIDDNGYIFFQGRSDDMINSSGERIGPFEVESKLIEHPAVAEVGVIGKPDAVRGEIVKAFVVLKNGYEASDELLQELRQFVRSGLAAHAAPREIEFLEELPKTPISGKILRRELKARELQKIGV